MRGLAFVAAIGAVAYVFLVRASPAETSRTEVFDRVWYLVSANYFDPKLGGLDWKASRERFRPFALAAGDSQELYERAIWPMLDQIEASHVDAARPSESSDLSDKIGHISGRRGDTLSAGSGVGELGGADAVFDGKAWRVYNVRKDSEADKAGVEPGLAMSALRVEPVREGLFRVSVGLTGDGSETNRVSYEFVPHVGGEARATTARTSGAVVMRFDEFDKGNIDWALEQMKQSEPAPLIIDLRANRGGDIDEMIRFLNPLLADDVLVGNSEGRRWLHTFPVKMAKDGKEYRGPVAVLIGPKTASAGEVSSYALGRYRKAPLVGERTAGEVLTASKFDLPDGGEMMIATGNLTTADNKQLEGSGVSPTIPASPTLDAIRAGRDVVIEAAERAIIVTPESVYTPGSAISSGPSPAN